MDRYKRYYGIVAFILAVLASLFISYKIIMPRIHNFTSLESELGNQKNALAEKQEKKKIVKSKMKKIQDSISGSQKKIYSPIESDLGNDSLFFTLYNDTIEMIHGNSVKIKAIEYKYNPEGDPFVTEGKDKYFVCDINMDLVSNYVNLGKLIQDLYQYPYYIRINDISVKPLQRDKRVLLTKMSIRLYANTAPVEEQQQPIDTLPDSVDDQ